MSFHYPSSHEYSKEVGSIHFFACESFIIWGTELRIIYAVHGKKGLIKFSDLKTDICSLHLFPVLVEGAGVVGFKDFKGGLQCNSMYIAKSHTFDNERRASSGCGTVGRVMELFSRSR